MSQSDPPMQEAKPRDADAALIDAARRQVDDLTHALEGGRLRNRRDGSSITFGPASDSLLERGYQTLHEIHRGGQGVVYKALQIATRRKVAIKVMREGPFAGQSDRVRFEREVQILGQLRHRNIVNIYDSGVAAGCHYFVMDYISGKPLDEFVASRQSRLASPSLDARSAIRGSSRGSQSASFDYRAALDDTVALMVKVCDAVEAAHRQGIVHRDLKPGNVRVDELGEPHILDFGLAKVSLISPAEDGSSGAAAMTVPGQFVGSLPWASPEQAERMPDQIDVRTDVYSLGVMLYQLITGRFPYDISGPLHDVLNRIINSDPARPRSIEPRIGDELETILLKCLAKQRDRRYASAGALADDLRAYLSGHPIQAKRDSALYLLRTRGREWSRRHGAASHAAIVVGACLLAQVIGVQLVYHWTPLNRWFQRAAMSAAASLKPETALPLVRVVALDDTTSVEELASRLGIEGVRTDDNLSLRRLHGKLLERLVDSGARAIAFDLFFPRESAYDADLVRGILAAKSAGMDVVIGVKDWSIGEDGRPPISPALLPHVRWGSVSLQLADSRDWALEVAMQRNADRRGSLSLATIAAFQRPGAEYDITIDPWQKRVDLTYWMPGPEATRTRRWLGNDDRLALSAIDIEQTDADKGDLAAGDHLAHLLVSIPPDGVLEATTLSYEKVASASQAELRSWLSGRVVLIADTRGDRDRHPYPDGRMVAGCYAHAVAIQALLSGMTIRMPADAHTWWVTALGSLIGLAIGLRLRQRPMARVAILVGLVVVSIILCIAGHAFLRYLCNPFVPLVAAVLTCEAAARVENLRRLTLFRSG